MLPYPELPLAPVVETGLVASAGDLNNTPDTLTDIEVLVSALKTIYDPEIPVNIHDLGLIYDVQWEPDRTLTCTMSLTSPACPVAGMLPQNVADVLSEAAQGAKVNVILTFDPPWTLDRLSQDARLILGYE